MSARSIAISAVVLLAIAHEAHAQTSTVRVQVQHAGVPVAGATVRSDTVVRTADATGLAVLALGAGNHTIITQRIGFLPDTLQLALRVAQDTTIEVELAEQASDVESVIVSATRSERRIDDIPLRVEVIDEEEVAEKAAMTPGDIAMMMNETSGLRVAMTSPSLGGANVRIQGLRGRYTLMLADGLPLYGGQGGFGLLQIPPVDLARAEIIKGTASALYGSAALGGVVNLVSRRPGDSAQRELLLNQTSRGGTDAVLYASGRASESLGLSMLASAHRQRENDLDGDGWADMPGYARAVLRPRLFFDREGQSLFLTTGYTHEDRHGGTLDGRTAPDGLPYEEGLRTNRGDFGLVGRALIGDRNVLNARASLSDQRHRHQFGSRIERDAHATQFMEVSMMLPRGRWTNVGGVAFERNAYRNDDVSRFDYTYRVGSVFAQSDVDVSPALVFSASARADWHNVYGASVNPRLSALIRSPAGFTTRLSAGTGIFAPTPVTEETEATGLAPVRSFANIARERGTSGSIDVTAPFETGIGNVELTGSVYASRVRDPVALQQLNTRSLEDVQLVNAPLDTRAWGAEALARIVNGDARITATYAYLRADQWDADLPGSTRRDVPLAPRHTAGVVASIEREGESRLGLEIYYTGRQSLEDNPYRATSRPYVIVGLLAERQWDTPVGRARFFVNAENIGNVRQTRFDRLTLPTRGAGGRWTTDVWTELSGATVNGGVRLGF